MQLLVVEAQQLLCAWHTIGLYVRVVYASCTLFIYNIMYIYIVLSTFVRNSLSLTPVTPKGSKLPSLDSKLECVIEVSSPSLDI